MRQLDKELLIDALYGIGCGPNKVANYFEEKGLASFSGNQYNEEWEWSKVELKKLSMEDLLEIYDGLRKIRESYAAA